MASGYMVDADGDVMMQDVVFQLLKLPRELRDMIYKFVLPSDEVIVFDIQYMYNITLSKCMHTWSINSESERTFKRPISGRGLIHTSRQIRNETLNALLRSNVVKVSREFLHDLLDLTKAETQSTISRLIFKDCFWDPETVRFNSHLAEFNKRRIDRLLMRNTSDGASLSTEEPFDLEDYLLAALVRRSKTRDLKFETNWYVSRIWSLATDLRLRGCPIEDFIAQSRFQELMKVQGLEAWEVEFPAKYFSPYCFLNKGVDLPQEWFKEFAQRIQSAVTQKALGCRAVRDAHVYNAGGPHGIYRLGGFA